MKTNITTYADGSPKVKSSRTKVSSAKFRRQKQIDEAEFIDNYKKLSTANMSKLYHTSNNRIIELALLFGVYQTRAERATAQALTKNQGLQLFNDTPVSMLDKFRELNLTNAEIADIYGISAESNLFLTRMNESSVPPVEIGRTSSTDLIIAQSLTSNQIDQLLYAIDGDIVTLAHVLADESQPNSILSILKSRFNHSADTELSNIRHGRQSFIYQNFKNEPELGASMFKIYNDPVLLALYLRDRQGWSLEELARPFNNSASSFRVRVAKFNLSHLVNPIATALNMSQSEALVYQYIQSIYNGKIQVHNRTLIRPYELDFVLPDLNLAIEVSPTYTHSYDPSTRKRMYHAHKHRNVANLGYELITIFSDWLADENIDKLKAYLNIKINGAQHVVYGRQVKLVLQADNTAIKKFANKYHLQGYVSSSFSYAFVDKHTDAVYGYASFGRVHGKTASEMMELKRLVFRPDTQVRYGLSKLVTRFFKDNPQTKILMAYSNNDMGNGHAYRASGFTHIKSVKPTEWYVNERDATDSYDWFLNTTWSAERGNLAKIAGSNASEWSSQKRMDYILKDMPHQHDNQLGYSLVFRCGSERWEIKNPMV